MRLTHGLLEYVVCAADDITDRRRAEKESQEQGMLLQKLLDNSVDLISITDLEGNFQFVSKPHELLGYGSGSLIGKNATDFVHPHDAVSIDRALDQLRTLDVQQNGEYRYRRKGGEHLWFETRGTLLNDADGNAQQILFNTRDITERKQVEEALRKSDETARRYLNMAAEIIVSLDTDGMVMLLNKSGQELLGWETGELLGKNWCDTIIPTDELQEVKDAFSAACCAHPV